MDIPLIKQVKIQAQVLVPLVKTLQAELGEERANAIVPKALGDLYRKYGEKWWRTQGASSCSTSFHTLGCFSSGEVAASLARNRTAQERPYQTPEAERQRKK